MISILVSSCDTFNDVWTPFFTLFFRYWSDCPYPIFLITNSQIYNDKRVKSLTVGNDKGWASNMIFALKQLNTNYLIYLQEDYFFKKKVDNDRINYLVNIAQESKCACLRLYPSPGPDTSSFNGNENIGLVLKNSEWRVSLQAALWNKNELERLCIPGESGWEMEVNGTQRSKSSYAPFLSVTRDIKNNTIGNPPLDYICTAIVKGQWTKDAVQYCKKEGISLVNSKRPILKGKPYAAKPTGIRKIGSYFKKVFNV